MFDNLPSLPAGYTHRQFLFEPLTPEHVELDFAAVMASQTYLRGWSMSDWPREDFSLEENRQDLEWHAAEHSQKIAFTFTILSPDREECLGCIYLKPPGYLRNISPEEKEELGTNTAFCNFWVRKDLMETAFEETIFQSMLDWLQSDWAVPGWFYTSNDHTPHLASLFERCGLTLYLRLSNPNRYQNIWKSTGG